MPFTSPVNTIFELKRELNLLASLKGGREVECRQQAKNNYNDIKAAARGTCMWDQFIIACTVDRADPNPDQPRYPAYPHKCGHVGVLVRAREGTNRVCLILDDTALQWDLPLEASHQPPMTRRGFWSNYLANLHPTAMPMSPPVSATSILPSTSQHILAEGPDDLMAFLDWNRKIAAHSFANSIGAMEVFSVANSDGMVP